MVAIKPCFNVSLGTTQSLAFDFENTLHGFIGAGPVVLTDGAGNNVHQNNL